MSALSGSSSRKTEMKTLILAAAAILTLGLGSAFANTPATQLSPQETQRAIGKYAEQNWSRPAHERILLAQQQTRSLDAEHPSENRMYPIPQGG